MSFGYSFLKTVMWVSAMVLKFSLKPGIALRILSLVDNKDEKKDECFSFSALNKFNNNVENYFLKFQVLQITVTY